MSKKDKKIAQKVVTLNNSESTIESSIINKSIIENETIVATTKFVKKDVDMNGGKIQFFTQGYEDGHILTVSINEAKQEVSIKNNYAVACTDSPFKVFPSISIND